MRVYEGGGGGVNNRTGGWRSKRMNEGGLSED